MEAQRVCAALIARGHRVIVLCAGGPPMPSVKSWTDECGVPVRIIGNRCPSRFRDHVFAVGVAWELVRRRNDCDVVYFLMHGLHLVTGLPLARWLGLPIVMKFSGSGLITMLMQSWLGRLELRWLGRWARRIMVLNQGMMDEAAIAGLEKKRLVWMPNPVDIQEFAPCSAAEKLSLRARLGCNPTTRIITFVGRLAPEKELASLIRAFVSICAKEPEALLVIIGDGPERPALQSLARDSGQAERIRFTGRLSTFDVRQWLQASDGFALVSSNEGFPCSLIEAMAVGLPAVVSNIPANLQLVDPDVNGLVVELRNDQSIAEALRQLIADEAGRQRMGAAARHLMAENYSIDRVLKRYETLFDSVTGEDQATDRQAHR